MKLNQIFLPCDKTDGVEATSKRQVLSAAAVAFAACRGLDEKQVFDILHERERLGSTAIGGGIAIPHGKLPGLQWLAGCALKLDTPVDFEAHDDVPVDLVVVLLAPETGSAEHLRVLARLSRMLRDPHQCTLLRNCPDGEALRQCLTAEADEQKAA
jgi:PTS system nitrogen regulatory IIA component